MDSRLTFELLVLGEKGQKNLSIVRVTGIEDPRGYFHFDGFELRLTVFDHILSRSRGRAGVRLAEGGPATLGREVSQDNHG